MDQSKFMIDTIVSASTDCYDELAMDINMARREDFFEGTEKLLEVWFGESNPSKDAPADLRSIDRSDWEMLLKLARCEVISFMRNDGVDSYVLSESSMFVSQRRFILKTCGTTTLLFTIKPLLQLVRDNTKFDLVENFFYSHKDWLEPSLQHTLHHSFDAEVSLLDTLFPIGSAHVLGKPGLDSWYLYTLDHSVNLAQEPDQTLEVLMTGLDPEVMRLFYNDGRMTARQVTQVCGIDQFIPAAVIDDILFQPCGYSMNGILGDAKYLTIHVTPEEGYSYASFETNVAQASFYDLIKKIVLAFRPCNFLVTILANTESISLSNTKTEYKFAQYQCTYLESKEFMNYSLGCLHYVRSPI